jgi:hypothetical protein
MVSNQPLSLDEDGMPKDRAGVMADPVHPDILYVAGNAGAVAWRVDIFRGRWDAMYGNDSADGSCPHCDCCSLGFGNALKLSPSYVRRRRFHRASLFRLIAAVAAQMRRSLCRAMSSAATAMADNRIKQCHQHADGTPPRLPRADYRSFMNDPAVRSSMMGMRSTLCKVRAWLEQRVAGFSRCRRGTCGMAHAL